MSGSPLIKICGLRQVDDVRLADDSGADFVGVVLTAGFGRSVDPEVARGFMEGVSATPVAVLVDEEPADAIQRASRLGAGVVQLHGTESADAVRAVAEGGSWRVWKAVRWRTADDLRRAVDAYAGLVDGFLVEGWKDGVVGGGGARLDPDVPGVEPADVIPDGTTFILAGGLTPDSVAGAMARFRPDVVDVSSGVEVRPGRKDAVAVRQFIRAVRAASGRSTQ